VLIDKDDGTGSNTTQSNVPSLSMAKNGPAVAVWEHRFAGTGISMIYSNVYH
jgi:hypothetical protein